MASFGGTTFGERPQGTNFPKWTREAEYTLTRVSGGNKAILDLSGLTPDKLTIEGVCSAASYATLSNKVGTVASLVFSGGTRNAFLAKLTPGEIGVSGEHFVTLEFIGR